MKELKEAIEKDLFRYSGGKKLPLISKRRLYGWRYTRLWRRAKYYAKKNKLLGMFYGYRLLRMSEKYGFQLSPGARVGNGLYIGHFGQVIVSNSAVLGNNVNLSPGIVIGAANRGSKKGAPKIGDRVWIGSGAVVVGGITIGEDVMIAPNAYVNFSVPSHSIVVGNPGVIHSRDNATEDYIRNLVEA